MIWEGVKELFKSIAKIIVKTLKRVLNFVKDVVDYFKKLALDPTKDTPLIIDAGKLGEQIKNAPRIDVGLFKGVYHEDTNTITDYEEVSATGLDQQTQDVLSKGEDGIVVLQ